MRKVVGASLWLLLVGCANLPPAVILPSSRADSPSLGTALLYASFADPRPAPEFWDRYNEDYEVDVLGVVAGTTVAPDARPPSYSDLPTQNEGLWLSQPRVLRIDANSLTRWLSILDALATESTLLREIVARLGTSSSPTGPSLQKPIFENGRVVRFAPIEGTPVLAVVNQSLHRDIEDYYNIVAGLRAAGYVVAAEAP